MLFPGCLLYSQSLTSPEKTKFASTDLNIWLSCQLDDTSCEWFYALKFVLLLDADCLKDHFMTLSKSLIPVVHPQQMCILLLKWHKKSKGELLRRLEKGGFLLVVWTTPVLSTFLSASQ